MIRCLQAGTVPQLQALLAAVGPAPRDLLREKEALGLVDPNAPDEAILGERVAHPALVNQPIVVTPRGVKLCRPAERVLSLLGPESPSAGPDGRSAA